MPSTESYKARELIRESEATMTRVPEELKYADQQIAKAQVEATLALAYAVLAVEKAMPD